MTYTRFHRSIVMLLAAALCIALLPARSVFGIERPDAADAGLDPGPRISAGAAIVYCENTGDVVYARESRVEHQPYAMAQLVTALVVVQTTPLDKKIKISEKAASQDGTVVGLKKGEQITVENLLYGMLLESGNDAAYALAESVSGKKTRKFVKKMNKLARNVGCAHTHFSDPAGLENEESYTTAQDFMKILRVALTNETVEKIAGTRQYTIPQTNKSGSRILTTTVPLLNDRYSGIYAGKGGVIPGGQSTVAAGYRENGLDLYIVLLDDKALQRNVDIRTLTAYAEKTIPGIQVVKKGKAMGKVRVRHGAETSLTAYTSRDGYAYLPEEGSADLIRHDVTLKEVTAPVRKGDVVGYFDIRIGTRNVNRVPLISARNIEVGWFPSYIGISNRMTVVITVVLSLLLIFVMWVLALRHRMKRRRARLRKREIRELARKQYLEEEDHRQRNWNFDK